MSSEETIHEKDARDWSHSSGSSSAVRSAYIDSIPGQKRCHAEV